MCDIPGAAAAMQALIYFYSYLCCVFVYLCVFWIVAMCVCDIPGAAAAMRAIVGAAAQLPLSASMLP